jgi:hypothetical protein
MKPKAFCPRIPKGQMIHIPIWAVNTDKEIWGDDAKDFRCVIGGFKLPGNSPHVQQA